MRITYRLHQFWRSLSVRADIHDLENARALLSPAQWELFDRLQVGEKQHALLMFHHFLSQGDHEPDLLVAALLHDVGKLRYTMNPLERAMVVLAKAVIPERAQRWGNLPADGFEALPGWRKAFVVAEHHAAWGADLARISGVSQLAETLIREHHHPHALDRNGSEARLLHQLWVVDNKS